jgi:hypothetical protein
MNRDRFRQGVGEKVDGFSLVSLKNDDGMTEVCCGCWLFFLLEFSLLVVSLVFPFFLLVSTSSLIDNVKRKLFFGVFREVGCWGGEGLGGDIMLEIGRSSQDEL